MELKKPNKSCRYYKPIEKPRRYPLELYFSEYNKYLEICLWSEDGNFKWVIASWQKSKEGYDLLFIGDRPLDSRVNWDHFRELVILGQRISDEKFKTDA